MWEFSGEPPHLVGWSAYQHKGSLSFHKVKLLDAEPEDGWGDAGPSGMSDCGYPLIYVDVPDRVRPYEHPCGTCFTARKLRPPRKRRTADIRPPLLEPVCPVGPLDLRVTHNGHLAIRVDALGAEGDWLIIDMDQPVWLQWASDDAAIEWRTLRTTWPTEALYNAQQLADRYEVERSLVSHWRRDGVNFPRPMVWIADRPGWPEELLPALDKWVATRQGRRRGRRKDEKTSRDAPLEGPPEP